MPRKYIKAAQKRQIDALNPFQRRMYDSGLLDLDEIGEKAHDITPESLEGIEDVEFLRRFRDDAELPGSVRLAAQKELTRVMDRKDAAAREAESNKEWTPPGDPSLLARAIVDVLRVQSEETLEAFNQMSSDITRQEKSPQATPPE